MERIILENGGYRAEIIPGMGANCARLFHEETGAEILRSPESEEAYHKNPNVYGLPLLFPPNRVKDGRYSFGGREYVFPVNEPARQNHIHGFLSRTAFETACARSDFAAFEYRATPETPYLNFPHAFTARVEYALTARGLSQCISFVNHSRLPMPFGAGVHATFNAPFLPGARAEDIQLSLDCDREWFVDDRILPTGETRDAADYRAGVPAAGYAMSALLGMGGSGARAFIRDHARKKQIVYEAGAGYRFWMTYNGGGGAGFVCAEPQTWMIDAPNRPLPPEITGLDAIEPGGARTLVCRVSISNIESPILKEGISPC